MPKYKGLSLSRFVASILPETMQAYGERLSQIFSEGPVLPAGWELINGEALQHYMDQPENAEVAAVVRQDFQRVNSIADEGTPTLVRAYQKYGIALPGEETPEQLAMRLFLKHPDAFDFAWSRYLLYGSAARLSVHFMRLGDLKISKEQLALFEYEVKRWFADQAKGEQCIVRQFEDCGEIVILIQHGTYMKAQPFWKDGEVSIVSLRPALEDVLVYEPDTSFLRIRALLPKDRDQYLSLFASSIAGDPSLCDPAVTGQVFTLAPVQDGSFDYGGAEYITGVELRRVKMRLYGSTKLVADLRSPDLLRSFRDDLPGLNVRSGDLLLVRLQFHLTYPNERPTTVTFTIEPPATTDLPERRHAEDILKYLDEQGVKLR